MRLRPVAAGGIAFSLAMGALAQELMPRVRDLLERGEADRALAALEQEEQRLGRLDPEQRFLAARLATNGDRFDRLSAEIANGLELEDEFAQRVNFARARELFARGQYLASLELLRALPPSAQSRLPEFVLFRAMAAQAVGEQRAARQDLESIPPRDPSFAMSRVLLADLLLRSREPALALQAAQAALDADEDGSGPQARFLQAQALEQMDRRDDARELKREILRRHPRSAEAAGLRGGGSAPEPSAGAQIAEESAPERRDDFALQLGAFRDRALALRQAARLKEQLDDLRIEYDLDSSPAWYRVIVGRYPTRRAAEEMQGRLAGQGIESSLLIPGRRAP